MHSKPLPDNSTPDSSPAMAVAALTALTPEQLQALLPLLPAVAEAFRILSGGMAPSSVRPVMLTTRQFADQHQDVTHKTVERWCRDGEFPYATNREGSGWRIPEFYLWADEPPPELRRYFERANERGDGAQAPQAEHPAVAGTRKASRKAAVAEEGADAPQDEAPDDLAEECARLRDFQQHLPARKPKPPKPKLTTTHRRSAGDRPETKPKARAA